MHHELVVSAIDVDGVACFGAAAQGNDKLVVSANDMDCTVGRARSAGILHDE